MRSLYVNSSLHIEQVKLLLKLVTSMKIDVLPGDGRNLFGGVCAFRIAVPFLVLQKPQEDRSIVK